MTTLFRTLTYTDVSTAHITERDATKLVCLEDIAPIYHYAEGFFISLPSEDEVFVKMRETLAAEGMSPEFLALITQVRAAGHALLRLDRDADVYDDLPKFDW